MCTFTCQTHFFYIIDPPEVRGCRRKILPEAPGSPPAAPGGPAALGRFKDESCVQTSNTPQYAYLNPPRFWCLRAANRPPGVFFSTSGVIGTPKHPQKTDPITKKEKVCRFYENRVVWALSCVFLNVFVRQT